MRLSPADLPGWEQDDHAASFAAFLRTCDLIAGPGWQETARRAHAARDARRFFEDAFVASPADREDWGLLTGYYEPEIDGAPTRTERFQFPIYALPPELSPVEPWYSRSEIENLGVLERRGLEIAFLENPVEVFFLQVQGSGRIRFQDGSVMRVGFAAKNGHPYNSIGRHMVECGMVGPDPTAGDLKEWLRANPVAARDVLRHNPSYVFFRKVDALSEVDGPIGTMGRPLTPGRSLAIDPAHVPLGAPVWVETTFSRGAMPAGRLMVAQDTGSAIKGSQRGDVFFGTGAAAGLDAGALNVPGRMTVLLPAT